jgi:hypothetical protein
MKHVHYNDIKKEQAFLERAKSYFTHNNQDTYTDGEIEKGVFFAYKWGADKESILIFKVDENFDPTVYGKALEASK